MDLSRATASAICNNSSRLAATALAITFSFLSALARLQSLVDELVGEYQFRVGDGAKREFDVAIVGTDHHIRSVQPQQGAAKALASFDRKREFDLGLMPGP